MVLFGGLLIYAKTMGPATEKYEHNLHLERFDPLNSNFAYAIFTTPDGKEVKYTIHVYFKEKVMVDRDYDIEYVPRSFNVFRPNDEIKRIDRTIPASGGKS